MKEGQRKYTGTLQYFHNYEHDPEGHKHCKSAGKHPYRIRHSKGKHIISHTIAVGHGKGRKPQWFRFKKRLDGGFDMASGVKINKPTSS
ncbi:hypothetical protein LCGC14_1943770 [marine sediment metagenome]|uniref:Uncharacterized protein n=1 Tax=marine sediment metagenome TaxID=412755 RepID=A0A0F9G7Y6_9ZZZZ